MEGADLHMHASDNTSYHSVYVSTSKSEEVAKGFAWKAYENNKDQFPDSGPWVYTVAIERANGGVDVNRALGRRKDIGSLVAKEQEIAVPEGK